MAAREFNAPDLLTQGAIVVPDPLVPSDVDLNGLDSFMLDTARLLRSDFLNASKAEEFKAGIRLWCKAWGQTPAASLPDDDRQLADFAGYGGNLGKWRKLKAMALRGWIKCSDGRLYHPILAADAIRAADCRNQRRNAANSRWNRDADASPLAMPQTGTRTNRSGSPVPDGDLDPEWARAANQSRERHAMPLLTNAQLRLRWEQFQNFWRGLSGSKALKKDWKATWINNCIDGRFDARTATNGGRQSIPGQPSGGPRIPGTIL